MVVGSQPPRRLAAQTPARPKSSIATSERLVMPERNSEGGATLRPKRNAGFSTQWGQLTRGRIPEIPWGQSTAGSAGTTPGHTSAVLFLALLAAGPLAAP